LKRAHYALRPALRTTPVFAIRQVAGTRLNARLRWKTAAIDKIGILLAFA
jgi:hypothetical protein